MHAPIVQDRMYLGVTLTPTVHPLTVQYNDTSLHAYINRMCGPEEFKY